MRVTGLVLMAIGFLWAVPAPALADKRAALVVGNAAYRHAGELANPVTDARAVGAALVRRGFDLGAAGVLLNADKAGLERALRDFRARSQGAAIAVLYFAGHGLQIEGRNRLVPVDGRLDDLGDVDLETVAVDMVLAQMRGTVNAVILDACRNNPFGDRLVRATVGLGRNLGADRGMARIDAQALSGGALLALAAAPGQLAKDGPAGGNSPYAAALVGLLDRPPAENPRLDLRKLFAAVRETVEEKTAGSQRPEAVDRLPSRDVYLIDAAPPPPPREVRAPRAVDDRWSDLEDGKTYRLPVLGNDVASGGGRLRVASVGPVSEGRAEVSGDGTEVLYTVPSGKTGGEVSFGYRVREDGGGESEGRVVVGLAGLPQQELAQKPTEALGLKLTNITPEARQQFELKPEIKGVLVTEVANGTPASEKGVRRGDVIVEVGQGEVKAPADVAAKVQKAREQGKKSILLLIDRQGDLRFVALPAKSP